MSKSFFLFKKTPEEKSEDAAYIKDLQKCREEYNKNLLKCIRDPECKPVYETLINESPTCKKIGLSKK